MPESDCLLAQCAIYLARAPKSREADSALAAAKQAIQKWKGPQPSVPMHIRNAPTKLMKELGNKMFTLLCLSALVSYFFARLWTTCAGDGAVFYATWTGEN